MRKLIGVVVAATLLLGAQGALAGTEVNRKRPPRLTLRYQGEVIQQARPFTYCWSHANDDGTGTGVCADGFPRYPKAAQVEAPARLVLRIHYPAKPEGWFLRAYRAIVRHEHYDETVGEGYKIPFKMRPHKVNGKVYAWNLIFRVEEANRHYYLDTGGDLRQGDAFYALHLRT